MGGRWPEGEEGREPVEEIIIEGDFAVETFLIHPDDIAKPTIF